MRLRSSHFVFLMLLICSVQGKAEAACRLTASATASRVSPAAQHFDHGAIASRHIGQLCLQLERLSPALSLDSAGVTAQRLAWPMPSPSRESTAIVSHTSLLRG